MVPEGADPVFPAVSLSLPAVLLFFQVELTLPMRQCSGPGQFCDLLQRFMEIQGLI